MFLNQTSLYALRAMSGMAQLELGTSIKAKELATLTGVPSHYLSKIMRKMVEAGFVTAQRGHGGGFELVVDPCKLRFVDVLIAVGYDPKQLGCAFGWAKCHDEKPCPMHPLWKKIKDCFNEWVMISTFGDIRDVGTAAFDEQLAAVSGSIR